MMTMMTSMTTITNVGLIKTTRKTKFSQKTFVLSALDAETAPVYRSKFSQFL